MSFTTWTPHAVATEARFRTLLLWRAVEAQHAAATRALVDDRAEQELLETMLDEAKPPVPAACARLHYLLYTPFRYPSTRYGSRFRAYTDPGAWYGADALRTACAEVGYWRWRFVADSDGLKQLVGVAHTLFQSAAKGDAIDLRSEPFARDRERWMDADDYAPCQRFAQVARDAELRIVRYASVREVPEHRGCAVVLDCRAFVGQGGVRRQQTWLLTVDAHHASWVRAPAGARPPIEAHEFGFG